MTPDTPHIPPYALPPTEPYGTAGLKSTPLLTLDFGGKAELQKRDKASRTAQRALVPDLNSKSSQIAERISEEIRRNLPAGANLSVEIQFKTGSIAWVGLVTVLDIAGKLSDGIDLGKQLVRLVQFVVNKVLRHEIEPVAPIATIKTTAKERSLQPVNRAVSFLWWCSGAVPEILRESRTDWTKFVGIGGAVLSTWALATASAMYALSTTLGRNEGGLIWSVLMALVWGGVIFNLDRYIVSTLRKIDPSRPLAARLAGMWPAVPRLLIAIVFAVTISKPMELAIFQDAIATELRVVADSMVDQRQQELVAQSRTRLDALREEQTQITNRRNSLEKAVADARQALRDEVDGRGGSGIRGEGPATREKRAQVRALEAELAADTANLRKQQLGIQNRLATIDTANADTLESFRASIGSGLISQLNALASLGRKEPATRYASYAVMALIILIEISPVIVKLLSPFGPYDAKLELRDQSDIKTAAFQQRYRIEIERYRFERLLEAEQQLESQYYDLAITKLIKKMEDEWDSYDSKVHVGGYASTQELYEAIRDTLFHKRTA